jgi:hypothetical protein
MSRKNATPSRRSSRTSKNLNSMMAHLQGTLSLANRQAEDIFRSLARINTATGHTIYEGRRPDEPVYNTLANIQEKVRALQSATADLQNSVRPASIHTKNNGTRKLHLSRQMTPAEKQAYRNAKKEKQENNRDPLIVALKNLREIPITNESHTRKSNNPKQPGEWSNTEETYTIPPHNNKN